MENVLYLANRKDNWMVFGIGMKEHNQDHLKEQIAVQFLFLWHNNGKSKRVKVHCRLLWNKPVHKLWEHIKVLCSIGSLMMNVCNVMDHSPSITEHSH